jgi:hypothetical protein
MTAKRAPPLLPVTYEEAVMLQYAREKLEAVRAAPDNPFDGATYRAELRSMFKTIADDNEVYAAQVLCMATNGIEAAQGAMYDLIMERNAHGVALGPACSTYNTLLIAKNIPPVRPPRGRPNENFLTNLVVKYLVLDLLQQFPGLRFCRTGGGRPGKARRPSACSIAADALGKVAGRNANEEAVRKIVEARLRPPKSGVIRFISDAID